MSAETTDTVFVLAVMAGLAVAGSLIGLIEHVRAKRLDRIIDQLLAERLHQRNAFDRVEDRGVALHNETIALRRQLAEFTDLTYAPGEWICTRCGFVEVKRIMSAIDGSLGVNTEPALPCPNDGEPMRRLTWRERARYAEEAWRDGNADRDLIDWLEQHASSTERDGNGWHVIYGIADDRESAPTLREAVHAARELEGRQS